MSSRILKHIDIELTKSSLNNAIKEVQFFQKQLVESMNELIRMLSDQGADVARIQVASMDAVDTGELGHSIYGYYDPETRIGYVIAGAPHAFYVEYGTGPIGEENPHPAPETANWQYNIGDTIGPAEILNPRHPEYGDGWWYPGDDGKPHWTSGQPSRPFMFNTLQWLEEAAETIASTVWNQM